MSKPTLYVFEDLRALLFERLSTVLIQILLGTIALHLFLLVVSDYALRLVFTGCATVIILGLVAASRYLVNRRPGLAYKVLTLAFLFITMQATVAVESAAMMGVGAVFCGLIAAVLLDGRWMTGMVVMNWLLMVPFTLLLEQGSLFNDTLIDAELKIIITLMIGLILMYVLTAIVRTMLDTLSFENRTYLEQIDHQQQAQEALIDQQQHQLTVQQELVSTIEELEMPLIRLDQARFVLPLIGYIDRERLFKLERRVLDEIKRHQVATVFIDLAAVVLVEPSDIQVLFEFADIIRLLGTEVVLTGITPGTAQLLVDQGLRQHRVRSFMLLQDALHTGISLPN